MANFMNALGTLSDGLGIISFAKDLLPEASPDEGATIGIKAGRNEKDDPGMDGKISAVYSWDVDNIYLGEGDGTKIDSGGFEEITVGQSSPGTQAEYVGVAVDKNAVCVAWVTVKQYDNTEGGAWTGDIGYNCDQHWYEQNQKAGKYKDSDDDYVPKCTWLDADHTGDTPSAAIKFNVRAYGDKVEETYENSDACDQTVWGKDNGPINEEPGKRALRPRLSWMEENLVVSNISTHHAKTMCESDKSWGPDFVGTDGYFCDMGTHTLSTLCSHAEVDGCLEIDQEGMAVKKRSTIARREVQVTHKSYKKIDNWE